jgi:hypothetical protein
MASVRRIAPSPPTRSARRRLGIVATSLAGGIAGLVAGAACVARVPQAASGMPSEPGVGDRVHAPAGDGVARVLAPAREAGVMAAQGQVDEDGAP